MAASTITLPNPRWGIRFERDDSQSLPLLVAPIPDTLVVSLHQHIGASAVPMVAPGDQVLRGQPIGRVREHTLGARVHAPTSGTVSAIEERAIPGRGNALCVCIKADGMDTPWTGYSAHADPLRLSTSALRHAVIEGGIVGLGGATFPSGVKLNRGSGVDTLILNAAECEPGINCDDALLRSEAETVMLGAQIMLRILEAERCVVAIKDGMDSARAAVETAIEKLGDDRFQLALVPAVYPVGGEAQLIQLITGQEIPSGGLPWDSGAICQNVGTAAAVARFLLTGEPLIRRIVTVTGNCIENPVNLDTRIGTPLSALIKIAGGYKEAPTKLIMGGPMMGVTLASDDLPVTKACNCIYAPSVADLPPTKPEIACIRCGDCATACPVDLMPQLILQGTRAADFERLAHLGLPDCIECGCCDYVCPSSIQLTERFATAKRQLWERSDEQRRAQTADQRFAAKNARRETAGTARDAELATLNAQLEGDNQNSERALQELLQRTANKNRNDGSSGK